MCSHNEIATKTLTDSSGDTAISSGTPPITAVTHVHVLLEYGAE